MVGKSGQPFKKSRKYGESAEDLQDRLDFVAALLALADEEIAIPPDKHKAQFKLEWVKADELRVSGILEQKQRNGQIKRIEKGITKKELGVLLETYRQKPILETARDELIQNALACLRDLGILKEHESAKNQGYWKFSLFLKHQTAPREENLQVIRDAWKEAFGELPQPKFQPTPNILNRCLLGLKGNYQDAQHKLKEITQTLQNRLNDKTLSITKVEEGSILLIVESSQTGYEQLKRLIGQEIAGFPVEYAIDEWQDICRRMLLDRKPLSSNTVIGQVYGNRNLIDEDLFVDLALVKPKRSQHPKHPQEIDPEKGSDLYNREEVEKRFAYREFLQEVIGQRTEKRLAIIGEPGAGKTTLLQKLAFWLLQETDDLVILVDLAELGSQPLGEYLEQKWLTEALRESREEIKADWGNKFEGGAVWLLLDGLDEMSQTDLQGLKFRGWVTDARMIVTCRLNLWQANPSQLQGFQTYLTQPFQDEQMQEFIRRWFRGLVAAGEDVQLAESLWSELQESGKERIKDLCRNPLRLTLLCATWKVKDALPETTADLYAGFVESMYEWKGEEFLLTDEEKAQLTNEQKDKLIDQIKDDLNATLGELAKVSLDGEVSRFRLTHRLVCQYLGKPKAKSSLLSRALKLGWLNEVGVAEENRREKVYGFYHATFQEYFAALAVKDWDYFLPRNHVDCPVEGKRYRIFEKQWKQVILLWLGREDIGAEEKEGFIRGLVEFEDGCGDWNFEKVDRGFYEYQAYFLAAAGINEFKACSLAAKIVRQVVKWGFGEFDIQKQKWTTFLDQISEGARNAIPETIRPLAISELINIVENLPDQYVMRSSIETLEAIGQGNLEVIDLFIRIIELNIRNEYICKSAIQGLGNVGQYNSEAVNILIEIIKTPLFKPTLLQAQAFKSLEKIGQGNLSAISALIQVIEHDYSPCRDWAIRTLEIIAKEEPLAIAAFSEFIAATKNKYFLQKYEKLPEKAYSRNTDYIADLVTLIQTTKDEDLLISSAQKLSEIDPKNPNIIEALIEAIEIIENNWNPWDEWIYYDAIDILWKVSPGNQKVITALVKLIETAKDHWVANEAAEALGKIGQGNTEAVSTLAKILETSKYKDILCLSAETLGKIDFGNRDAIATLIKLTDTSENENIRLWATKSLGKIGQGNPTAIATLVKLTNDNAIMMMKDAAETLRKILTTRQHYAGVVTALKDCLSDEVCQNDFDRFNKLYEVIWNCAENLPYPEFYQAWHNPPTTPHPEVTEQTPHSGEQTFASPLTWESLQHLPLYCLNADLLADETREREIALTLSELIWEITCPDEDPPEPATPAELRRHLKTLKRRNLLPHRAILFGSETVSTPTQPTPELMAFCQKLTGVIAVAFLTDDPLEAPLKGFPPNQPNPISAIETWLGEI
ncbi:histidine kinase [Phormidium willei BDU 130791]|nr:histidine kinase [Phormidium willei BDU 130791]